MADLNIGGDAQYIRDGSGVYHPCADKKNRDDLEALKKTVESNNTDVDGEIDALKAKDKEIEADIDALQKKDTALEAKDAELAKKDTELQTAIDGKVSKTGDTMSGALTVNADVTAQNITATASYKVGTTELINATTNWSQDAKFGASTTANGLMTKTDKTKLDALASGALKYTKVDALPETGEDNTVYLVQRSDSVDKDSCDEYLWTGEAFELIGSSKVDLTGYAKSTDLANYLKKTEEAASAKKVAHKLSITQNGGIAATYDGSADTSIAITAASVGAAPANHTHNSSQITDLQSKLDGKANSGHTHSSGQITDLQNKLDGYLSLKGGTVNGNVDVVGEVGVRNSSNLSPCDYRFINWTFAGGVAHFVLRKDMHNSDNDVTLMETHSDTDKIDWSTSHEFHKDVTIDGNINTDSDTTGYIRLRSSDEVRIQAKNTLIIEDSNNNDTIEFSTNKNQPEWNFGDSIVKGKYVKHRTHIVIASHDTKNPLKGNADYTCTEGDATTPFLEALENIAEGGRIELLDGTYNFKYGISSQSTGIVIDKKNITIEGSGFSTAVLQPREASPGESSPIFTITATDVKLKNLMLCSVRKSETEITSTTPMIQQQAEGTVYDSIFFIHDRVLPECSDSCIYGSKSCSHTRIQNCRVYSVGDLGTDKAVFDFSLCTSFSGIISGIINSGNNNTSIKLKDEAAQNNVQFFGNQRQEIKLSVKK